MLEKPELPTLPWAYLSFFENDIVQKPNSLKISQGYIEGEKPSHLTFNWVWQQVLSNVLLSNNYGINPWDAVTEYIPGSVVNYNGIIWRSNSENVNIKPGNTNDWIYLVPTIENLSDTDIYISDLSNYLWDCNTSLDCDTDTGDCAYFMLHWDMNQSGTELKWVPRNASIKDIPIETFTDIEVNYKSNYNIPVIKYDSITNKYITSDFTPKLKLPILSEDNDILISLNNKFHNLSDNIIDIGENDLDKIENEKILEELYYYKHNNDTLLLNQGKIKDISLLNDDNFINKIIFNGENIENLKFKNEDINFFYYNNKLKYCRDENSYINFTEDEDYFYFSFLKSSINSDNLGTSKIELINSELEILISDNINEILKIENDKKISKDNIRNSFKSFNLLDTRLRIKRTLKNGKISYSNYLIGEYKENQ